MGSKGRDLLIKGSRRFGLAIRIVGTEGRTDEAADAINEALRTLRSAMNWLEDSDLFEVAHQRLDSAGSFRREHFLNLCRLAYDENGYAQQCPVALAHNRVGLSIGYVVRAAECSICGLDPDDCEHIVGRRYYDETCHRVVRDLDLLEVSLVGRPTQPDARIESIGVSEYEVRERLGQKFRRGMPVTCDRCLSPCDGVSRPFEGSSHGVVSSAPPISRRMMSAGCSPSDMKCKIATRPRPARRSR